MSKQDVNSLDYIKEQVKKIDEEFNKNLKELIKDQQTNGVVQNSYGGLTVRLGDEKGFINKKVPA